MCLRTFNKEEKVCRRLQYLKLSICAKWRCETSWIQDPQTIFLHEEPVCRFKNEQWNQTFIYQAIQTNKAPKYNPWVLKQLHVSVAGNHLGKLLERVLNLDFILLGDPYSSDDAQTEIQRQSSLDHRWSFHVGGKSNALGIPLTYLWLLKSLSCLRINIQVT